MLICYTDFVMRSIAVSVQHDLLLPVRTGHNEREPHAM